MFRRGQKLFRRLGPVLRMGLPALVAGVLVTCVSVVYAAKQQNAPEGAGNPAFGAGLEVEKVPAPERTNIAGTVDFYEESRIKRSKLSDNGAPGQASSRAFLEVSFKAPTQQDKSTFSRVISSSLATITEDSGRSLALDSAAVKRWPQENVPRLFRRNAALVGEFNVPSRGAKSLSGEFLVNLRFVSGLKDQEVELKGVEEGGVVFSDERIHIVRVKPEGGSAGHRSFVVLRVERGDEYVEAITLADAEKAGYQKSDWYVTDTQRDNEYYLSSFGEVAKERIKITRVDSYKVVTERVVFSDFEVP